MLDTKLKNSKRKHNLALFCMLFAFSLGFLSLYPYFEEKAAVYEEDPVMGEVFLSGLLENNYVIYKDLKEKATESKLSYEDLYLDVVIEPVQDVADDEKMIELEMKNDTYVYQLGEGDTLNSVRENEEGRIRSYMQNMREQYYNELNGRLDFCAIDHESGTVYKNTGRSIEKIAGTDKEWENPYVYYIKMKYDKAGNPGGFAAFYKDSDELLKRIQNEAMMKKEDALFGMNSLEKIYYNYDLTAKMTIRTSSFSNVTFLYAMTQEQMDSMLRYHNDQSSSNGFFGTDVAWMRAWNYYKAGVGMVYGYFLIILTVIVFILSGFDKMQIGKSKYCKGLIEAPIIVAIVIAAYMCSDSSAALVNNTNNDYFANILGMASYEPIYPFIKYGINIFILMLTFGLWYWCMASMADVRVMGIRQFLKERSLICRYWNRMKEYGKYGIKHGIEKWQSFKRGLINADLNGDVKKVIFKAVILNFIVLSLISCLWFFGIAVLFVYSIVLFLFLRKHALVVQEQYRKLLKATNSIAAGELHTVVEEDMGVFESYRESLCRIQEGFRNAVDEEVKSQKLKTELITNVSHDLKTPLTAIITYIDLLKEENVTEEQRKDYIATLEHKSLRLKVLIEDLFEVSKAESKNVTFEPVEVDICSLIRQVYLEHSDDAAAKELDFRFHLPEEKVVVMLDSQKTYRIFENLYGNILKYAMPHTRVYVDMEPDEEKVKISMKNMSANELNISPEEITERFVRGDSSRNTEGSGLGLAIAKSFTELQGGKLNVVIDGDLYKVILEFTRV